MSSNSQIRIIKPDERRRQREARVAKPPASANRIAQEKSLDAADIITGWVDEWRQHKQQSAQAARRFMRPLGEAA